MAPTGLLVNQSIHFRDRKMSLEPDLRSRCRPRDSPLLPGSDIATHLRDERQVDPLRPVQTAVEGLLDHDRHDDPAGGARRRGGRHAAQRDRAVLDRERVGALDPTEALAATFGLTLTSIRG